MKIALAQLDPTVGDFRGNVEKIKEAYDRAERSHARVLLTPELGLCGYPAHDLLDRPEMIARNENALSDLAEWTKGKRCALVVGHVSANLDPHGRLAQNTVSILEKGAIVFSQSKTLLPTYDVFDESRYFEPARDIKLWNCDGNRVAIAICEDLWGQYARYGKRIYTHDPLHDYQKLGAQYIFSLSASPYEWNKRASREEIHKRIAKDLGVPLIYVNQVGATDEILFDGGSFLVTPQGEIAGRLPYFSPSFGIIDGSRFVEPAIRQREDHAPRDEEILCRGLILGIRDYFSKTGFRSALIGLSGGIDSAVVAVLAVAALGPQNVSGVAMPSQYSSGHSLEDAELLAQNLGIRLQVQPIKFLYSIVSRELSQLRGSLASLALENLQARLRGIILMSLSNHSSSLVLTTGNKSELATGYCTLYGDMVGALAPIGDLYKTQVYQLAKYLNDQMGQPIPERCLTKAPSAELRPNQTDQDSLPPYELLDRVLFDYLEKNVSVAELNTNYESEFQSSRMRLQDLLRIIEINEYKRRQGAPVLRVSQKAFGIGRRIPIAKRWDQT